MPDCVVVDWNMPDGDAIAFLQKLRKLLGATDTDKFVVPSNQPASAPA